MWTDDQLNAAKYVGFVDPETNQDYNLGTMEITTGANQGVYIMRPVPPFGSLNQESPVAVGPTTGIGVYVPAKSFAIQFGPRAFPVQDRPSSIAEPFAVHDFGKPHL